MNRLCEQEADPLNVEFSPESYEANVYTYCESPVVANTLG